MTSPLASASARTGFGRSSAGILLVALLVLLRAGSAHAQAGADPYSATVKVDATASNAVEARRLARLDGERRALTKVVEQVSDSSDAQLPKLDDTAVTDMVKSFEVAHERMSAVRYLADYTFHFYPDKVRRLMHRAGLAVVPVAPPTHASPIAAPAAAANEAGGIVILPVYQDEDGAQAVLWDDPNPWREAWSDYANGSGAAHLIVPLGDIGDLAAIDAMQAQAGRPDALAAIARRNGGDAVIVALAKPRRNAGALAGIAVKLKDYRGGRLVAGSDESITAAPGESQTALLTRAVIMTAAAIGRLGKIAAAGGQEKGSLAAVVPITSLGEWIAVRQRLASVAAIREIALLSLNREEARIRLSYVGSPDQLKSDLAAVDLALDGGDPVWRLHPADAAAPR